MTCTVIIHICCEVMLHTLALLPNFDFYLCLRVKFHKSSFWVFILAAWGPFWVPISQKVRSLFQSLGVPISFGHSGYVLVSCRRRVQDRRKQNRCWKEHQTRRVISIIRRVSPIWKRGVFNLYQYGREELYKRVRRGAARRGTAASRPPRAE